MTLRDAPPASPARILAVFRDAGRPAAELADPATGARAVVIPDGARVACLSFSPEEPSVLFSHPGIDRVAGERLDPVALHGGPGGDRVRFAPESTYAWVGDGRDFEGFSNYRVQEEEDPGRYRLDTAGPAGEVRLSAEPSLVDRRAGASVRFSVERALRLVPSPLAGLPAGVRYAGYASRSTIARIETPGAACLGLWHLLQFPVGTTLVLPLRTPVPPVPYFNRGDWALHADDGLPWLGWTYGGTADAKIGYACAAVTGRAAALRGGDRGGWVLVVLDFPIFPGVWYCDAPSPQAVGDQVFQAWDGFGFGEVEYHAPAVGDPPLPAGWEEQAQVWAFGGPRERIREIARELLGVVPGQLLTGGHG